MSIPTAILEETWPNTMVEGTIDITRVSIPSAILDETRTSAVVEGTIYGCPSLQLY